jgi:hypothetical protein
VRWRSAEARPPAPALRRSPDAPEARDGQKRETAWPGDTGHGPDPGAAATPHLSTAVTTTPATPAALAMRPVRQATLAPRQLTPGAPLVDAGEVTSAPLLTSRTAHGSALLGPVADEQRWPGQGANGVAAAPVVRDGAAHHAIGPPGQRRGVGLERPDRHGQAPVRIAFRTPGGTAGARRAEGPRAAPTPRALRIRARDQYTALQAARARQQTATCQPG